MGVLESTFFFFRDGSPGSWFWHIRQHKWQAEYSAYLLPTWIAMGVGRRPGESYPEEYWHDLRGRKWGVRHIPLRTRNRKTLKIEPTSILFVACGGEGIVNLSVSLSYISREQPQSVLL